jgi:hypothetical protein
VLIQDLPGALRRFTDEQSRRLPQIAADRLQDLYDRVLRDGEGKSVDEVKVLLASEWRSMYGKDLSESDLSERAAVLAAGRRIVVKLRVVS